MKRIGILTSGGDCPGLNAVIRAVVKCASHKGWEVYGIPYGTDGFIGLHQGEYKPEELRLKEHGYDIPGLLQGLDVLQFLSGSILGSLSKGNPDQPEIANQILAGYQLLGLDALIAVGGDGSLDIIYDLAQKGNWNLIGIPKTIDNDVPFTERSVGFDTAINTVTNALYDLTFTAASHDRVMVVQVMGRDAGHLALDSGIAAGADVILIPELTSYLSERVIDQACRQIAKLRQENRKFALVVVAEGVKNHLGEKDKHIAECFAKLICEHSKDLCHRGEPTFCLMSNIDTRSTVLGHIQRSGIPSSSDRLLAIAFGKMAVDLIDREQYNQLVVWQNGRVQIEPLELIVPLIKQCHHENRCARPVKPDDLMVQVAQSLGIYIGDLSKLERTDTDDSNNSNVEVEFEWSSVSIETGRIGYESVGGH